MLEMSQVCYWQSSLACHSPCQGEVVWLASTFSIFVVAGQISGGLISNRLGRKFGSLSVCPIFLAGFLSGGLGRSPTVVGRLKKFELYNPTDDLDLPEQGSPRCSLWHSTYQHFQLPQWDNVPQYQSLRSLCRGGIGDSRYQPACPRNQHWSQLASIQPYILLPTPSRLPSHPDNPWVPSLACYEGLVWSCPSNWSNFYQGKSREALEALMRLRGADYNCLRERDYLETSYRAQTTSQGNDARKDLMERIQDPDIWKPFLIVNLMFLIQVGTGGRTSLSINNMSDYQAGVPLLTFFVISIMRATGTRLDPNMCALLERTATVLGQLLASLSSYKFTRKSTWTISSILLCLLWLGLASTVKLTASGPLTLFGNSTDSGTTQPPEGDIGPGDFIPPVLFILLRLSFQMCLGPFPWIYGNELYPLDLRSYLCAVTSSLEPVQVS